MAMIRPMKGELFLENSWDAFRQLQDEMSRFVGELYSEVSSGSPLINIWHNEHEAVVLAELPGVDEKKLDISAVGKNLTLKGERSEPEFAKDERPLRTERVFGPFGRSIQLPFDVDADGVKASLKNGILKVVLPRRQEEQPRKVAIAAE